MASQAFLSKNVGIHTGSFPFVLMLKYITVFIGFKLQNTFFSSPSVQQF